MRYGLDMRRYVILIMACIFYIGPCGAENNYISSAHCLHPVSWKGLWRETALNLLELYLPENGRGKYSSIGEVDRLRNRRRHVDKVIRGMDLFIHRRFEELVNQITEQDPEGRARAFELFES